MSIFFSRLAAPDAIFTDREATSSRRATRVTKAAFALPS
jgi:hypothetical protein